MSDTADRSATDLASQRKRAMRRWKSLEGERSGNGWDSHWQQIAKNLLPRQSRFMTTDRNKGGDFNQSIIDSAGTFALRTLVAGMMAGMTSPARPWFKLSLPDKDMAEQHDVKVWLADCTNVLLNVFRKSNTYNMLHGMYRELGSFGTGLSVIQPNFDTIIHNNLMTVGQYALGIDQFGFVDKLGREFKLSVEEAAAWFGLNNLSPEARNAYDRSNYDYEITVLHLIEPNADRDPRLRGIGNMPFRSVYWDRHESVDANHGRLRAGGYTRFPALAPRWDLLWGDIYGSSPGMEALGDLKQLQNNQFRKDKLIDYRVDPPLQVPTTMRGQGDFLPGGVSYYDALQPQAGVRAAFELNLDPSLLLDDIRDVRDRINRAFYADMFLLLAQSDKTMTATEVAERHEEKLLMLGPVLERLHNELLSPLVTYTFEECLRLRQLPPVPEVLDGVELEVEYISMLAQAQKAVSVNSTDRLIGHLGLLVQLGKPEALDKFDADKSVERYADQLGVDPDLMVADEQVALIRQQRAEAQQAAQQAEMINNMADSAQKLGTVQTGAEPNQNAANDILNLFSGYSSPSSTEL